MRRRRFDCETLVGVQSSKSSSGDRPRRGFTLLEMVIVLAIVGVLGTVVVIALDPVELFRKARDSKRVSELKTLSGSLDFFMNDVNVPLGVDKTVYISVGDPGAGTMAGDRSNCASLGLPPLAQGWTYSCVHPNFFRRTDGNGWLPINLQTLSTKAPFASLPVDPVNDITSNRYYAYVASSSRQYVLTAGIESQKFRKDVEMKDNGTDSTRYEMGNDILLWARAKGLVGYWPLDETSILGSAPNYFPSGSIYDFSGNGRYGTLAGPTLSISSQVGKRNLGLSFEGAYAVINNSKNLNPKDGFSVLVWVKTEPKSGFRYILAKETYVFGTPLFLRLSNNNPEFGYCYPSLSACTFVALTPLENISNQWHLLAGTYTPALPSAMTLYLDNKAVSKSGITMPNDISRDLLFAKALRTAGTETGFGLFDEIRIYNRALTAAEIKHIYEATK